MDTGFCGRTPLGLPPVLSGAQERPSTLPAKPPQRPWTPQGLNAGLEYAPIAGRLQPRRLPKARAPLDPLGSALDSDTDPRVGLLPLAAKAPNE